MSLKQFTYAPGLAAQLFAVWTDESGQYWNALTAAFEAYSASNWTATKYLVAVTEPRAGEYKTTIPSLAGSTSAPVVYHVRIYFTPTSGTPSAANDFPVTDAARVEWDGTAEVKIGSRLSTVHYDATAGGGSGTGPYPITESGGLGAGSVAATIDVENDGTFAAWSTPLHYTSDGSTIVSGLTVRAYAKAAFDATAGSGLAGSTTTNASGGWNAPLMLDSGDYYLVSDAAGDSFQSSQIRIRVP
jgi:hypothetical protein